ncbi:MAG TPA: RIP metalloprotease RseP [Acidobacteriaceae bacterium]|jgi:regulator of sigma E protease|nr:RIP metalloprotease RseP [Acidobacteriaceae bacterium]
MSLAVISIVSFFLVLSVMVLVHELGHFIVAKACGVRVETFSLGFPPRLFGVKIGETDYCIGALPIGGYVKMSGETPGAETTGDPGEFSSHPRWQRMLIAVAGPVSNFILAFVLMAGYYMMHNEVPVFLYAPAVLDVVPPGSPAGRAGLESGDKIVRIDKDQNPTWAMVTERAGLDANSTVPITVERTVNGQKKEFTTELYLSDPSKGEDFDIESLGLIPREQDGPLMVEDVVGGGPAAKAGLRSGDGIVSINGQMVHNVASIIAVLSGGGSKPATLVVARGGQEFTVAAQPIWDLSGETPGYRLMFNAKGPPFRVEQSPLPKAIRKSVNDNLRNSSLILDILGRLFSHHGAVIQQLNGPIGIARATGEAAEARGWEPLVGLSALISLNLGIMNLLPIPILDGGMILLLAIEGVLRRDLKQEFKERVYQVAFVMLILIFAFVMVNDVSKLNLFSKLRP